ncbi:MAG: MFS transporter [Acidimicrobiia bacterium]|jgi:MFS family permease|nr:MFS transporter [Acidimicrobiia bacterium]MDQ3391923.1 MFS transporter [Actinomycetota bacterium]
MSAIDEATHSDSDRLTGTQWALLLVLSGAIFLEGIDVSMMGVALPSIRSDLGMSTSGLQWVVSAYVLGYAGLVLLGGRAGDLLGRRRVFITFLTVFLAFSGLGGLATESWMLVLARFVTGVAAAFLTPVGLSIITTTFAEGRRRNQAVLVYAGAGAGGFSLGMVAGGLLTSLDWRWVFFAPVLVSAVILVGALRLIPSDDPGRLRTGGYDLAGAALLTAGMLTSVYTVVRVTEVAAWQTLLAVAASVGLLARFAAVERRSASPLMRFEILRSGALVRANVVGMLWIAAFVGFQFAAVLYLQELRGWSELETGLALMVIGIDAILAPLVTPHLVIRFGNTQVIVAGLVAGVAAYAAFLPLGADWTYMAMLPTFLTLGVAFSLTYGPLTIAATDGVAEEEQGLASGLLTMSFQFGAALGLAVVTAVLVGASESGDAANASLGDFRTALTVPFAATVLGGLVMATARKGTTGPVEIAAVRTDALPAESTA